MQKSRQLPLTVYRVLMLITAPNWTDAGFLCSV